jgi:hypothetical protein
MAASRSTLDANGMAAFRSILDTNWDGNIPVDTRHKWWSHHPGQYSTQMGMVPSRSIPLSTEMEMVSSRLILTTNGDGIIPVDTRHKWGWQHHGRYSTQMVKSESRSTLDTNRDGSISGDTRHKWGWQHPGQHSTQMGWQHPGRYSTQMGMVPPRSIPLSTQMGMAAPRSILDTNGDGATPVDTRHKWWLLYPCWYSIQIHNHVDTLHKWSGCTQVDTRRKWRGLYPSRCSIQTVRAVPM